MGIGNVKIDELMTKTVVGGKIISPLPTVLIGNRYYPMFSISSLLSMMIVAISYM